MIFDTSGPAVGIVDNSLSGKQNPNLSAMKQGAGGYE
jgi:hypothetical protein